LIQKALIYTQRSHDERIKDMFYVFDLIDRENSLAWRCVDDVAPGDVKWSKEVDEFIRLLQRRAAKPAFSRLRNNSPPKSGHVVHSHLFEDHAKKCIAMEKMHERAVASWDLTVDLGVSGSMVARTEGPIDQAPRVAEDEGAGGKGGGVRDLESRRSRHEDSDERPAPRKLARLRDSQPRNIPKVINVPRPERRFPHQCASRDGNIHLSPPRSRDDVIQRRGSFSLLGSEDDSPVRRE
jgi:hypothetical protein